MARTDNLTNFLTDVADAIRTKTGSQETISASDFDTAIEKIAYKPNKIGFNPSGSPDIKTTEINLKNLDTSNITTMAKMFNSMNVLSSLDLSDFNTKNATNFSYMFNSCASLTTITFGENFTFENATNLGGMIFNCTKLDNNTLNTILYLCTTVGNDYTGAKTLYAMGVRDSWNNYANIPNLSNYQDFLDAGWTIS